MLARRASRLRRRGSTTVETALVIPVVFMFIFGTCIIALWLYYYHQVASLAREGARYASVHGNQYALDVNNGVNKTASDIYNNAIKPMAVGLNLNKLGYQVQWGTKVSGSWVWTSWDASTKNPTSIANSSGQSQYDAVQVTVTYQWTPGLYITGTMNLASTAVMPMSY